MGTLQRNERPLHLCKFLCYDIVCERITKFCLYSVLINKKKIVVQITPSIRPKVYKTEHDYSILVVTSK